MGELEKKAAPPPPRNAIFSYYNGKAVVFADPLTIHRRLTRAFDGAPNETLAKIDLGLAGPREDYPSDEDYADAIKSEQATEPMRYEATERMLSAIRDVFHMEPFNFADGSGATEADCRGALDAFIAFMESKKKAPVSLPTSPPPTEPASPWHFSGATSATKTRSASG